jgi:hypothetical protein
MDQKGYQAIVKIIRAMIAKQTKDVVDQFAQNRGGPGTLSPKELDDMMQQKVAAESLQKSADVGRIGYADPTSPVSTRELRKGIAACPVIPLDRLNVGLLNTTLADFLDGIRRILRREMYLLAYQLVFGSIDITSLTNCDTSSNASDQTREYCEKRSKEIDDFVKSKNDEIAKLTGYDVKLWDGSFCVPTGFFNGWWRYHRATLPERYARAPNWKVNEVMSSYTTHSQVIKGGPFEWDVWYESTLGRDCNASLMFTCRAEDHPDNRVKINDARVAIDAKLQERAAIHKQANINEIRTAHAEVAARFDARQANGFYVQLEELIKVFWRQDGLNPTCDATVDEFCGALRRVRAARQVKRQVSPSDIQDLAGKSASWAFVRGGIPVQAIP